MNAALAITPAFPKRERALKISLLRFARRTARAEEASALVARHRLFTRYTCRVKIGPYSFQINNITKNYSIHFRYIWRRRKSSRPPTASHLGWWVASPSKIAVTPAASTKVEKLMGTLFSDMSMLHREVTSTQTTHNSTR